MSADPVADFLAREQAELGDLDADLKLKEGGSDVDSLEDLRPATQEPSKEAPADAAPVEDCSSVLEDSVEPDSNNFAAFESTSTTETINTNEAPNLPTGDDVCSNTSSTSEVHVKHTIPVQDSELMSSWKDDFLEAIQRKDEAEAVRQTELEAEAKRELQTWYNNYRDQLSAKAVTNRSAPLTDESGAEYGKYSGPKPSADDTETWERVCGMCDMQEKNIKLTKDTSRMRRILLNLKSQTYAA